jgi:hypothetical protein
LKRLSRELQPYSEVRLIITDIFEEVSFPKEQDVRVTGHLISYMEHQFGDRVPGKNCRQRANGEEINNWVSSG